MFDRVERLSLRLRVFLFFAALAVGILGALGLGLWLGAARVADGGAMAGFMVAGLVAGFLSLGLIAWIWYLFDENVARAAQRLAGGLRARAHAQVDNELDADLARYLGDLAPAAQAVAGTLVETQNALAEAVERETTRLALENARLQALLADVPAGVFLCSADHQIVFYNGPAVALFPGAVKPGLDRPIFDYLQAGALTAALDRLQRSDDPDAATDLLCASVGSTAVFAARMRLVEIAGPEGAARAYVLTLRDVTSDLALHAGREALLGEIFDRVRRPAANLQTVLAAGVARDAQGRAALLTEVESLAGCVTELGARYDADLGRWWPMTDTRAADLAQSISARSEAVGLTLRIETDQVQLRCDPAQIVAMTGLWAKELAARGAADVVLRIEADEGGTAMLTFEWDGAVLPLAELDRWQARPLDVGLADITGARALTVHGVEVWPMPAAGGRASLCLPLPLATGSEPLDSGSTLRAAVYDFDLMTKVPAGDLAATPLRDLTCVVFDTETTGLLPSSGDEIVQIAALRLLGGKRIPGECFETLVDPGRPIPAAATKVHHVTDEMVRGKPDIGKVGREFHSFAHDAVLVAHNAPFDLEFLRRHERDIGLRFDNPVLDTVLLSAVVFGQSEVHTLDALTERLGIVIPPEARHTAMGDTIATAAALEMMIPMLEAQGLTTFGEVIAAVRKHGRLLKDVNSKESVPA